MNCNKCGKDLDGLWYRQYKEWYFCQSCEEFFNQEIHKLISDHIVIFNQPERSKREDSYYTEFGCSNHVNFITSDGVKRIEPGKRYDSNLNEI